MLGNGSVVDLDDGLGWVHLATVDEFVLFAKGFTVEKKGHFMACLRVDFVGVYAQLAKPDIPF